MIQLKESIRLKEINEYRPFQVVLTMTQRVVYVVDARTSEQAEDLAEELARDGDQPQSIETAEIAIEEVVPVDEVTSDEQYSDATGFHV